MVKKYNWGIIGPGSIAHKFASDLRLLPNAFLYAVGSRDIDRARDFALRYGTKKFYGSYEELATDPGVDIIYIATPHVRHYSDSILCLKNKKAVLCEKPVAMNTGQFRVMMDTAKKHGVFLMEALWTRFIPSFQKCLELALEGAIGDIRLIESDFCFNAPYDISGRLFNPHLGGGSLLDIGIYPVFLSLELAGNPITVHAQASFDKTGVDSSCSMLFYQKNDIISVLFSSLVTSGRIETLVHGSKGLLRLNRHWHIPTDLDLIRDDGTTSHFNFEKPGFGYQYEAEEVMKCLDEGKLESGIFSLAKSQNLITVLDTVRSLAGISYPNEIERV